MSLSIIVPFYNAERNSDRLLSTLASLRHEGVEVICIDDGSTDGTLALLEGFAASCVLPVTVVTQPNAGPGSARNVGLRAARGEYVWFVDCDDDIRPAAIEYFVAMRDRQHDFIDFDIVNAASKHPTNTMGLEAGDYVVTDDLRANLIRSYGALCTKITRRSFLISHGLWYPEYCYFEDNLLSIVLPFFATRFHKTDLVGYVHHLEFESITRQSLSPRYFDRLHTAYWGLTDSLPRAARGHEREALVDRFTDLFALKTVSQIFGMLYPNTGFMSSLRDRQYAEALARLWSHLTSLWYLRAWAASARVLRYYREIERLTGIHRNPLHRLSPADRAGRTPWRAVWLSSLVLRRQARHFARLRSRAWNISSADRTWVPPVEPGVTAT